MREPMALVWLAALLGATGVGGLRLAWSYAQRSAGWVGAGWGLIAASAVVAWHGAGAWGVAVAALVAMATALVALGVAALRSPPGRKTAFDRRTVVQSSSCDPMRIGRRLATFLITVPGGFLSALALGLALRGAGLILGWGEANATVAALFAVPISWAVLATILLMQPRRRGQALTLLGCAVLGAPFMLGIA
ncbi:hypothetical protein NYR55_04010 [Sphingomonas sp. BGYR3]|uniref:hypothetical protein n=1 Tax=Sphingomonas sp. BGYR3 TaxID=2975483 RepID=UPI0021A40497|nr:hypothetical protein [Sphingomonas sp. BGYR3]MDG5487787.1 hypothetical protein [Sphingomonas sp. BGYR3]